MKEIFEQYGSVIIAAVAISALVAIIVMLLATDGVVANSFKNLIDSFLTEQLVRLQVNLSDQIVYRKNYTERG